jgi:hypothetical protein
MILTNGFIFSPPDEFPPLTLSFNGSPLDLPFGLNSEPGYLYQGPAPGVFLYDFALHNDHWPTFRQCFTLRSQIQALYEAWSRR